MVHLKDTTFIIPIFIDSEDRIKNCKSVMGFLNHNFKSNIIIHEYYVNESKLNFLNEFKNLNIKHLSENIKNNNYHRTKQLNKMLSIVDTDVVCNYDIDVLLPPASYIISERILKDNFFDVVYPYGFGKFQLKISQKLSRQNFDKNYLISNIEDIYLKNDYSEYGHCVFFRTDSYKNIGGENENFISYGPEDSERYQRCHRFGLRLHRIKDYVYHFEHSRTNFSNKENPDFINNEKLFLELKNMSDLDFISYYNDQKYCKNYQFKIDKKIIIESEIYTKNENHNEVFLSEIKIIPQSNSINPIEKKKNESNFRQNIQLNNINKCICGQPFDKISYNYCIKCGKMY
jgi:hypothetical protein